MYERTITDIVVAASLISSFFWWDSLIGAAQDMIVLGGFILMFLRGWLIWQEIRENRKKRKKDENGN